MAGGPINGSGFYTLSKDNTGIIVPTLLQTAADVLSYWTSMTCLYDPWFVPDPDKATLPICIFHATKIQPTYSIETSKKRVILYEQAMSGKTSAAELANQFRENVMRSIIENSVKMPTTYTVEAIVPFQPVGRYIADGIKTITDMITGFSDLLGGVGNDFSKVSGGIFASVFAALKYAQQAVDVVKKLPGNTGVSLINMNSLEAMAESCRTHVMKMWTGYNYKFVQITNLAPDKRGNEDDVFRVTMTLQEKNVLAVTEPKPKSKAYSKGWAVGRIHKSHGDVLAQSFGMGQFNPTTNKLSGTIKEAVGNPSSNTTDTVGQGKPNTQIIGSITPVKPNE